MSLLNRSPASSAWRIWTLSRDRALTSSVVLPELLGVHLAKALVTLQRHALAAMGQHRIEQGSRAADERFGILALQSRGLAVDLLELVLPRSRTQASADEISLRRSP
jgi:hypothetical protein